MSSRKYTDQSLKTIISEMLRDSGMERKFNELEVIRCYREVVGDVVSRKTREVYLKGRTLVLKMDSGALKQELSFQKTRIIGLINERLGSQFLEQLDVW
jgi:hypothetical protein